ncbi:MAG TPA: hypothetical protein VGD45_20400 [Steroidobacter sp.]|uniref:hypothetical protein n=1 Tax=Steroidobacter sp. TaxID=1978227 RepID=UPI002ED8C958
MSAELTKAIGTLACLTAMAASLKFAGAINWSWWWVLLPPAAGLVLAVMFLRN